MIRLLIALLLMAAPLRAEIAIQQITSPGGIPAWLVEDDSIPFVALELTFAGGASLDRPGKRGAAYLMTGLIEEGAGDLDAAAFQARREALAARFGFDIGRDTLSISAQVLSENRAEAMALLGLALNAPRFDQDAIDRVRAQVLSGLRSQEKDPNDIASRAFAAATYGDHPYATAYEGTPASVAALTQGDVTQAYRDLLVRGRAQVSAVGDITAAELGALVDDLLGALPQEGPALPGPAAVDLPGGLRLIDYDTPQSVAIFAQPGLGMEDPDFFAAYILNTILGGWGPRSRLTTEVREKRGLTYGIGSYLVDLEHADLWLGQVASANSKMAEAIQVIRAEWADMAQNGVTAEELARAQTYLTGAYPLRFDGNGRIANILAAMQIQGRSPDYITTRNARINAVTLEQINAVAARLMRPDQLGFTVVGRPQGLGE